MTASRRNSSRSSNEHELSPSEALSFLDPELVRLEHGPQLVRVLLDESYETDPIAIPEEDGQFLLERLMYHRLLPQLRGAIAAGRIAPSEELVQTVAQMETSLAITGLRLEHMLVQVGDLFSDSGVDFLVLKGLATGRLDRAQLGLRQAADVDVLVRSRDFDRARSALAGAGFVLRDAAVRMMDKGETWAGPLGDSLDLHTRLHTAARPLGEEWWESSELLRVAGHDSRALNRGGRLAHAASHYALSYPNHRILSSLLDVVVISRLATTTNRDDAQRMLREMGVSDLVLRITTRAAALVCDPGVVLGRPGNRPLDVALRRAYNRPDLDKAALKLAKTFGMPHVDQMRVIRNWVSPSDVFLEAGGYASRLDRLTKIARRQHRRWHHR